MANGDAMAGIRIILEEMRDLKREFVELRRELSEDRKQAAVDRKESNEVQKDVHRAMVVIGNAGKRILQTQDRHTKLLEEIRDAIKGRRNGRSRGNGH